jgi:large subunit ribosomal protein L21
MATKKVKTTKPAAEKTSTKKTKVVKPVVKTVVKKAIKPVAVIEIPPRQFLVEEGSVVIVNNLNLKDKEIITPSVLLTNEDKKTQVGQPYVKGAVVKLEHLKTEKGEKVRVAKFKAKSRYRRVQGHRQLETHLKVKSISF